MKWYSYLCVLFFLITGCASNVNPIHEISNPVFDKTDNVSFRVKKIIIEKNMTYVYCEYTALPYSWANISSKTNLVFSSDSIRLLKCEGLPFSPEKRHFRDAEKIDVALSFPRIATSVGKIDIKESDESEGFNIYGIDLSHKNDSSIYSFSLEQAVSLSNRAEFFCSTGNIQKAIELEEQALNIKKAYLGCKSPGYATSVFNLAWYYSLGGHFDKAILFGNENLKLCEELLGTNNDTYGNSLLNLASYYHSFGKYEEAEEYEKQAAELYLSLFGRESQQYARAISDLAQTCYAQGWYTEAIQKDTEALEIRERLFGKVSNEYAMSLHNLSLSYSAMGDILKAIDLITKAVNIKRDILGMHDPSYIMSLNNLASYYSLIDNYEKACSIEEDALQLCEAVYGVNHPEYAKIISNLGGYYLRIGKMEKGVELLEKAHQLIKDVYGDNSEAYAISLNNLSHAHSLLHNYDKAISYELEALKILEKGNTGYVTLLSNIALYYSCINDYEKATSFQKEAISAVKETMNGEFYELDSEAKYLFWQNTHSLFDDVYPSYVAKNKNSSTLSDLYNSILFSKGIVWRNDLKRTVVWTDIQKNLGANDIVIEFISPIMNTNDTIKYYALTIKKGQESPKMIELFDNWQFIDSMTNASNNYDKNLKAANLVWKPLENELKGIKNIYFSPTHVLNQIPIEYLPLDSSRCYSDVFSMYRLSSSRVLANPIVHKKIAKAFLYGDLVYEPSEGTTPSVAATLKRSGFEQLFNTKQEVSEISQILEDAGVSVSVFTEEEGTERSFMDLSGSHIDVLHLATHGMYIKAEDASQKKQEENYTFIHSNDTAFYQSDALSLAFLVLANGNSMTERIPIQDKNDGIVTALDISKMDFSGLDIVTLSACESALGEFGSDDGVLGLQRGFKIAGANTILMSLDKVDDEATRILMVEFYKKLMNGYSKLRSLRDAQKYLRQVENGKYDNPKYWASFIMLDGLN